MGQVLQDSTISATTRRLGVSMGITTINPAQSKLAKWQGCFRITETDANLE